MTEHIKMVIWPRLPIRHDTEGSKVMYRYMIVGMLMTDEPIESIEGKSEVVVDGVAAGLVSSLDGAPKRAAHIPIGGASHILAHLTEI